SSVIIAEKGWWAERAYSKMSNRLISPLSEDTTILKSRLVKTINEAVDEINKIHELYDHFFASSDSRPTLALQIEEQLELIKSKYVELFKAPEDNKSKIKLLDEKIEEIREFHRKLTDGDDSIQANIKESQAKITAFYVNLFQTYEAKNDGGQEAKLKAAFDSIISFDDTLNKADVGYRTKIEKAKAEILDAYKELFGKDRKTNLTKIDILNQHITEANEFHEKLKGEISPFIDEKQKYLNKVASDIETKQTEVDSLLSKTTIGTLSQGYLEAMQVYGDPVYGVAGKGWKGWSGHKIRSFSKAVKHFIKFLGSYLLFIGPLILIGWIFVSNGWQNILNVTQDGNIKFSGSEYIIYKLTIALPLLWVSWYGQKNISHRKRLFEEYNHKLRVVQMYLQFTAASDTYTLSDGSRKELEQTLLETISKNPSEVYGKDDTLIDKLIDVIQARRSPQKQEAKAANPLVSGSE
ncbi:MAG TPA: hypothetical protein VFT87_03750, partial [Candidatus Saccharimonadales bacterium]|nr:hypothetical protein [Candidatus Saccharimonadales bacterium]